MDTIEKRGGGPVHVMIEFSSGKTLCGKYLRRGPVKTTNSRARVTCPRCLKKYGAQVYATYKGYVIMVTSLNNTWGIMTNDRKYNDKLSIELGNKRFGPDRAKLQTVLDNWAARNKGLRAYIDYDGYLHDLHRRSPRNR